MTGYGRGPEEDRALALRQYTDAHLALLAEAPRLERLLDDLRRAQDRLHTAGIASVEADYGRVLNAARQVHAGVAFWHRDLPDPTPAALTQGDGHG